jgi:hypothetical protein
MPCPVCRKRRVVEIKVVVGERQLTMHSCSACTARWWDADGEQVKLPKVLELATVRR